MPKMQGAAVQCCMCITGVFMFLGGLIMLATGICLILNYGVFDVNLLPPDLQNEEGKKTIGIILTVCGLVAVTISVIVSALYLCTKNKSATIDPDSLMRIPNSARNGTPDKHDGTGRNGERRRSSSSNNKTHPALNGAHRPNAHAQPVQKSIPGSTEVRHPKRYGQKKKGRKYPRPTARRLEEIKEQDAISRKTVEGAVLQEEEDYNDTPRSGSICSELTLEDKSRLRKVVLDDGEVIRAPSVASTTASQSTNVSDLSNRKQLDHDKSRRETQFVNEYYADAPETETFSMDSRQKDNFSIDSDKQNAMTDTVSRELSENSAGGSFQEGAVGRTLAPLTDSDSSILSYKAVHSNELHGENTSGRISPQVGETFMMTNIEIDKYSYNHGDDVQS